MLNISQLHQLQKVINISQSKIMRHCSYLGCPLAILKNLQFFGLQPKVFCQSLEHFSLSRSEQFWKQNTISYDRYNAYKNTQLHKQNAPSEMISTHFVTLHFYNRMNLFILVKYLNRYLVDVLWCQPIKLIHVISTSKFHEY